MRAPVIALSAALAGLSATMVVGVRRVAELEAHEVDVAGEVVTLSSVASTATPGSYTLARAPLDEGDRVVFELCSGDAMDPAVWARAPASVAIFYVGDAEDLVDRRALDAELLADARRTAAGDGSCVVVDRARLTTAGSFEVRVEWEGAPAFADVPMRARIVARPVIESGDGNLVFVLLCFALLVALAGHASAAEASEAHDAPPVAAGRVALGVGLALVCGAGLPRLVPTGSHTASLIVGLALAGLEIGLALGLARPKRGARLAWGRNPRALHAAIGILVAPLAGILLQVIATLLLANVESTGEAPIETFVALPSGMFSFALLAVVVPLAEEIFFRGFLFGTIEAGPSRARFAAAFTGAWLLFALVHLPQTYGNWGGLASILVAGLGFTALRAFFRSTPVSALAHLVYNGLLAAAALQQAIVAGS